MIGGTHGALQPEQDDVAAMSWQLGAKKKQVLFSQRPPLEAPAAPPVIPPGKVSALKRELGGVRSELHQVQREMREMQQALLQEADQLPQQLLARFFAVQQRQPKQQKQLPRTTPRGGARAPVPAGAHTGACTLNRPLITMHD